MDQEVISTGPEQTKAIGGMLAETTLKEGSVVVLRGDLGAGKTQFTKGIAHFYGLPEDEIASPTYALVNEYDIQLRGSHCKLYHLDCYRFEKPEELIELGVEEYLYPKNAITVIEWPERIEAYLPADRIEVKIVTIADTRRTISISDRR